MCWKKMNVCKAQIRFKKVVADISDSKCIMGNISRSYSLLLCNPTFLFCSSVTFFSSCEG